MYQLKIQKVLMLGLLLLACLTSAVSLDFEPRLNIDEYIGSEIPSDIQVIKAKIGLSDVFYEGEKFEDSVFLEKLHSQKEGVSILFSIPDGIPLQRVLAVAEKSRGYGYTPFEHLAFDAFFELPREKYGAVKPLYSAELEQRTEIRDGISHVPKWGKNYGDAHIPKETLIGKKQSLRADVAFGKLENLWALYLYDYPQGSIRLEVKEADPPYLFVKFSMICIAYCAAASSWTDEITFSHMDKVYYFPRLQYSGSEEGGR